MNNLIICGAARAGTTSLFRYLSHHPEINAAQVKELNYFLGGSFLEDDYIKGVDYSSLFKEGCWSLEASPAYMQPWSVVMVSQRIKEMNANSKLLFILRDPIKRLYSQYQGNIIRSKSLRPSVTFQQYLEACINQDHTVISDGVSGLRARNILNGVEVCKYIDLVDEYRKNFSEEQIFIAFTETLKINPYDTIKLICEWLDLPIDCFQEYDFQVENKMIQPQSLGLYRMALKINKALQPLLNNNPQLRSLFRNIHNMINSSRKTEDKNNKNIETMKFFETHLRDSQVRLSGYMREKNEKSACPNWVHV